MKLRAVLKKVYFYLLRIWNPRGLKHIGSGTVFRKPLRIQGRKYISIGSHCDIMDGIRLEAISRWNGEVMAPLPEIKIEDYVVIGQYCHFTAARRVSIGEGSSIMPNVLITDIKHTNEQGKSLADTGLEVGSVSIGKYVQIGMGARIMANGKNLMIGDNAIIGANAVVTKNVKENSTVVGIPAKYTL